MIEFKEPYDEASDICRAFLCMVGLVESSAYKLCVDVVGHIFLLCENINVMCIL